MFPEDLSNKWPRVCFKVSLWKIQPESTKKMKLAETEIDSSLFSVVSF